MPASAPVPAPEATPAPTGGGAAPRPGPRPPRLLLLNAGVALLVAAITLLVFARLLRADFVQWDDDISIYANPHLGGLSLERLRWALTDVDSTMRYIPLTLLSWVATYQFWGLDPFGYHLGNWLLHGLNAALLFLSLRRLVRLLAPPESLAREGRVTAAAAVAALLWSLHPLRVEPVAWANARSYDQALTFVLLSFLLYPAAVESRLEAARRRYLRLALSAGFYLFALLSHPIALPYAVALVAADTLRLRRARGGPGWESDAGRRALLEKVPFAAAAAAVGAATVMIRVRSAGVWEKPPTLAEFGLADRAMQAAYVWGYYVWRPFAPVGLSPVYTRLVEFRPFSWPFVGSAAFVAGLSLLAWLARKSRPEFLAAWLCYLAFVAPVIGFAEHPHYTNDRYALLASLPFTALFAGWLATRRSSTSFKRGALIGVALNTVLATLSVHQTAAWDNTETLFRHMIRQLGDDPYRYDIYARLGKYLVRRGEREAALDAFRRVVAIVPAHAVAQQAVTYLEHELACDARAEAARLELRVRPDNAAACAALIEALEEGGRPDEAMTAATQAVQDYPIRSDAYEWLGILLVRRGRLTEAEHALERALALDPASASAESRLLQVRRLRADQAAANR